jgi:hypothetical protein
MSFMLAVPPAAELKETSADAAQFRVEARVSGVHGW